VAKPEVTGAAPGVPWLNRTYSFRGDLINPLVPRVAQSKRCGW